MSSEMRELVRAELRAARDTEDGVNRVMALLARTEAGADGAFVAWAAVSPRGTILALYGDKAQAERDVRRFGDIPDAVIRPLVWGDTHPQDASGDAEDAKRYRAQFADGTWFYCLEWVGLDKAALDRDIDAMQAKEAK